MDSALSSVSVCTRIDRPLSLVSSWTLAPARPNGSSALAGFLDGHRVGRDLEDGTTLEVDTEVEPSQREGSEAEDQEDWPRS